MAYDMERLKSSGVPGRAQPGERLFTAASVLS